MNLVLEYDKMTDNEIVNHLIDNQIAFMQHDLFQAEHDVKINPSDWNKAYLERIKNCLSKLSSLKK